MLRVSEAPVWLLAAQAVEFIFLLISVLLGLIAGKTVASNRFFHSNMHLLLKLTGICWFLTTFSRMASILEQFICPEAMIDTYVLVSEYPHVIFEAARVYTAAQGAFGVVLLIFERILASIFLENYEHRRHTGLVLLIILCTVPIAAILSFFAFSSKYGFFVALLAVLAAIFLICLFVFVDKWNRRRLVQSTQFGVNYTLNERFQLTENIRSGDMIFASINFGCFGTILPILLLLSIRFIGNSHLIMLIIRAIFNLYTSVFSIALVLVTVTRPHAWKMDFQRRLYIFARCILCPNRIHVLKKESIRQRIRNADGRQLAFSLEQEAELYFNQLTASWNNSAIP